MAGNYLVYYAYPVSYGSEKDVVLILLVRDARREMLEIAEIRERFRSELEEKRGD